MTPAELDDEPIGQYICLAVGCPEEIERGRVFCPRHWGRLSDDHRRLLIALWSPRRAQCAKWRSAVSVAISALKRRDGLR